MSSLAEPRELAPRLDPQLFEPGQEVRRKFFGQSAASMLRARLLEPLDRLFEDRFGADVLGLGLEVAQQAMAQRRDDRVVDVFVADADAALEQRVDLGAQDERLGAARTRAEAQVLRDFGNRAGAAGRACADNAR